MNYFQILVITLFSCSNLVAQENHLYHQTNETNSLVFEEKGDMAVSIASSINVASLSAYSVQFGCSPVKHFNISGAYFREYGNTRSFSEKINRAFTFSIGTNYKINWIDKKHLIKGVNDENKELNLILNFGFTQNRISYTSLGINPNRSKAIEYHSFFTKFGFSYKHKFGRWSLSGLLHINDYKKMQFEGNWVQGDYLNKVATYFENRNTIQTWSMNFHNEIGRRVLKLIFGANFIISDQFRDFEQQLESAPAIQFYIGTLIDFGKMKAVMKRIRKK